MELSKTKSKEIKKSTLIASISMRKLTTNTNLKNNSQNR